MFSCICPLYLILQVETNLLRKLPHPSENIDMEVPLHTNFGVEVPPPRMPPVLGSPTEKFNQSELPDSQSFPTVRASRQSVGKQGEEQSRERSGSRGVWVGEENLISSLYHSTTPFTLMVFTASSFVIHDE